MRYGKHAKKRKRYITKKAIATIVIGASLTGAVVGSSISSALNTRANDLTGENKIGYYDIGEYANYTVHQNNFVTLKVSSRNIDITSLRNKIEKCLDNDISCGLILDTKASNLGELYKDIDFLYALILEYNFDFPIYLNIDYIMSNTKLTNIEKTQLLEAFSERVSLSNICYGFYGHDSILTDCNRYIFDISSKDIFLVKERSTVTYPGKCGIVCDIDGSIKCSEDYSTTIVDGGYNDPSNIVIPTYYVARNNDTYQSIAIRFGLSEDDLKDYNDGKRLKVGDLVKVPNLYQKKDLHNGVTYNYALARGITLTGDESTSFDKIANSVDYLMIRCAYNQSGYTEHAGQIITKAASNMMNAIDKNIPFGIYFEIEEDMKISVYRERLDGFLSGIENRIAYSNFMLSPENIPLFVKFNKFYEYNNYYELIRAVKEVAEKHGFKNVGLYGSSVMLDTIIKDLHDLEGNKKDINSLNIFIWQQPDTIEQEYDIKEVVEPRNEENGLYKSDIIDASSLVLNSGAYDDNNHSSISYLYNVDLFKDQVAREYSTEENLGTIKIDLSSYTNIPFKKALRIALISIMSIFDVLSLVIIGGYVYLLVRAKKEEKEQIISTNNRKNENKQLLLSDGKKRDQY